MTTEALIDYLKIGLDPNFTLIQRYIFVQIDTNVLCADGKAISVFVSNLLPEKVILSDSGWVHENTYFDAGIIPYETKKEIIQKWNIKALEEEHTGLFYVHTSTSFSTIYSAINDLIQCIVELSFKEKELKQGK